jgi:hypothetical protein
MKTNKRIKHYMLIACVLSILHPFMAKSQTDMDAIMMSKKSLCIGPMYGYSNWKNYWEGTFKRDNKNLGRVSTQMFSVMGIYGITKNLNVIANLPYIKTKVTEGTLHGLKGFQDLSLWIKWRPFSKDIGKNGTLSLFALGGVSFPVSDYTPDFLPMSIGLHSTNLSARVIADYLHGSFFITSSATYSYRDNIKIDRNSYYTTEMHLTNEVKMPDVASFNFKTGYRGHNFMAEVFAANMTTLGGFDIRKNDMPFPSNKMNATLAGVGFRYAFKKVNELSIVGDAAYVVAGRNVGQATSFSGGVFYAFSVSKKHKKN